jgi:hypothetical protein
MSSYDSSEICYKTLNRSAIFYGIMVSVNYPPEALAIPYQLVFMWIMIPIVTAVAVSYAMSTTRERNDNVNGTRSQGKTVDGSTPGSGLDKSIPNEATRTQNQKEIDKTKLNKSEKGCQPQSS